MSRFPEKGSDFELHLARIIRLGDDLGLADVA
jgi:hypothetical protein